jgi:hypothetical protein
MISIWQKKVVLSLLLLAGATKAGSLSGSGIAQTLPAKAIGNLRNSSVVVFGTLVQPCGLQFESFFGQPPPPPLPSPLLLFTKKMISSIVNKTELFTAKFLRQGRGNKLPILLTIAFRLLYRNKTTLLGVNKTEKIRLNYIKN